MKMIKKAIDTFKNLIKLESLKLVDFSLSILKGFTVKLEFYEKKEDKEKK